jgi:hypothetical protein
MSQVLSRRLEAQIITFLFQPYHQYVCVCVLERVSAARIQCLLQSQKSGEVPCEHLSDVFVFVLILSVGLGTSQSGQIREFWHLWPPLL